MKWFAVVACSMAAGALGGAAAAISIQARYSALAPREVVATKTLVIENEAGLPVIRMGSRGETAKLEFLANGGTPILVLETNRDNQSGTVQFVAGERQIAGLQMRPNTESTLFLGDSAMEGRVILGAPGTDVMGEATEMWGLRIQSRQSGLVTVGVANDKSAESASGPYFGVYRRDGTVVSGAK